MNRIKLIPRQDWTLILVLSIVGGSLTSVVFRDWRLGFVVAGVMALILIAVVVLFNYGSSQPSQAGRKTDNP